MPAPSTIVTFTDADGDEFPVRVVGRWSVGDQRTEVLARGELDRLIEAGDLRPTMPVKVTKVEAV